MVWESGRDALDDELLDCLVCLGDELLVCELKTTQGKRVVSALSGASLEGEGRGLGDRALRLKGGRAALHRRAEVSCEAERSSLDSLTSTLFFLVPGSLGSLPLLPDPPLLLPATFHRFAEASLIILPASAAMLRASSSSSAYAGAEGEVDAMLCADVGGCGWITCALCVVGVDKAEQVQDG